MKALFKKEDMSAMPRWTDNIKDEWINPLIIQSCELYFYDAISNSLYDLMANLVQPIINGATGLQWLSSSNYSAGEYVLYNESYYKAKETISSGEAAPDQNNKWELDSVVNFWSKYVKPYLIYRTYNQFLLWHGKHISQGGFRKHTDNTSFEISPEELGYLLADTKSFISIKEKKMLNYLNSINYTFNNIKYEYNSYSSKKSGSFNIFAV